MCDTASLNTVKTCSKVLRAGFQQLPFQYAAGDSVSCSWNISVGLAQIKNIGFWARKEKADSAYSLKQWRWNSVNFGRQWRIGRPGMLLYIVTKSQTQLNWTETILLLLPPHFQVYSEKASADHGRNTKPAVALLASLEKHERCYCDSWTTKQGASVVMERSCVRCQIVSVCLFKGSCCVLQHCKTQQSHIWSSCCLSPLIPVSHCNRGSTRNVFLIPLLTCVNPWGETPLLKLALTICVIYWWNWHR